MSTFAGVLAQAVVLWAAVLVMPRGLHAWPWWLACHAAGAAFLVAGHWLPRCRLSAGQSLEFIGYAALLAVLFWGANEGLDLLGNSVHTKRLPPEARTGVPLHLLLVPGVVAIGTGALAAALVSALVQRRDEHSKEA